MNASIADDADLEPLRILASAMAGRAMEVAPASDGQRSWTDGTTVFLEPDASPADRLRTLAVQTSLVAAGSFEPDVLRHLLRRPQLTRRFLAVEGHRALLANEPVLPPLARPLIDRVVGASTTSPAASLTVARRKDAPAEAPSIFGAIDARRALSGAERALADSLAAPSDPQQGQPNSSLNQLPDEDEDDEGALADLLSSPVGGGGPVGKLLKKLLRPARRRGGGGPPGADAPTHSTAGRPGNRRNQAAASSSLGELESVSVEGSEGSGTTYPEWDAGRRRYRPDWCTVIERDAEDDRAVTVEPADGFAMRRSLARLGTGLTRIRRQAQGDDIDIDAAVEAHIDTLAGSPHGYDAYLESLRRRRDLGVLVLLDISGSAGEPGVAGKRVHDHQRAAAASLVAALHQLGDRVALYGFNSRGRRAVEVVRVKGFDAHLDGHVGRRLAGLEPAAYTRLGAAIRHGTTLVERGSGTPRRLLVVLSDGFAYDHGYEGRYGEADARRALTEARRRGVGCVCLSVGADTAPESLRRVFGSAAHASVPAPAALPGLIAPLFRAALRTAEAERRTFQRTERSKRPGRVSHSADPVIGP